jgi:hypothetical protein
MALEPLELGVRFVDLMTELAPLGPSRGATRSCVGTPLARRARYSIDCSIGTRGSSCPTTNIVRVFTRQASFNGE